ncbi:hypothetical protein OH77DRAFT_1440725 [Trametes cingulata]|nr:hypothetical protein OH77DRAFT_1440725 [Trametes cingulata]
MCALKRFRSGLLGFLLLLLLLGTSNRHFYVHMILSCKKILAIESCIRLYRKTFRSGSLSAEFPSRLHRPGRNDLILVWSTIASITDTKGEHAINVKNIEIIGILRGGHDTRMGSTVQMSAWVMSEPSLTHHSTRKKPCMSTRRRSRHITANVSEDPVTSMGDVMHQSGLAHGQADTAKPAINQKAPEGSSSTRMGPSPRKHTPEGPSSN